MLFAVSLFLKLTSFHHVCHDNRYLMSRVLQQGGVKNTKNDPKKLSEDLSTLFNINDRTLEIAL